MRLTKELRYKVARGGPVHLASKSLAQEADCCMEGSTTVPAFILTGYVISNGCLKVGAAIAVTDVRSSALKYF